MKWILALVCAAVASSLGACTLSEAANPQWGCDGCDDGRCVLGFCVASDGSGQRNGDAGAGAGGTANDAGGSDSGTGDEGGAGNGTDGSVPPTDGGGDGAGGNQDAGGDAAGEPCETEGEERICYEGFPKATAYQPPCRGGTQVCEGGTWGPCVGQVLPSEETCDGVDQDCDGETDEDLVSASCTVEGREGQCQQGVRICVQGEETCYQVVFASAETCDGVDQDCDGLADEDDPDLQTLCYPDATDGCDPNGSNCRGQCRPGVRGCDPSGDLGECVGAQTPQDEAPTTVGDSVRDEDCDGEFDEGFDCVHGESYDCYEGPASTLGQGPCRAGQQMCTDGQLGECVDQVLPEAETCGNEGRDDDCNGAIDDVPQRGAVCDSGLRQECRPTWQCVEDVLTCVDPEESAELCDGLDNDCDGSVDEGFDLQADPEHCGACGIRCTGAQTCCSGLCVDTSGSNVHCGGCGTACEQGLTCCSGDCVNTTGNDDHCRGCGIECTSLEACRASGCSLLGLGVL